MCGIIGMVTSHTNGFSIPQADAFEQLLYLNALRGEDSTGVVAYYNDGSMQMLKDNVPASYFLSDVSCQTLRRDLVSKGKAFIGHNRKKTVGGSDVKSAHPFAIAENVLFVHNGTLHFLDTLKKDLHKRLESIGVDDKTLTPDTNVDSHYLGTLLGMCDGDKTKVETVLSNITGAYACVWVDQKLDKLFIVKNKERPLWYVKTPEGIFWSSELNFLYAILVRNNIKIESHHEVPVDVLLSIDLTAAVPSFKEEPLTLKKALPQVTTTPGNHTAAEAVTGETKVSKRKFKAFCKQWLNKLGSFYIDDFVERDLYSKKKEGFYVWGDNDNLFDLPHLCRASLPQVKEREMYDVWAGSLVSGTISRIEADVTTGTPVLIFSDIKPIVASLH